MKTKFIVILALLTCCILVDTAFAYKYKDITYNVYTEVEGIYDDNISYTKDNTKADFIFGVDLGLSAKYEGKRLFASFLGRIVPEIYCQNPGYNNIDEYVSLNTIYEFTRFDKLFINNDFSHTYNPEDFDDEFGRIGGRYSYFRNNFSLMYEKDISSQIRARAGYKNQISLPSVSEVADSYYNEGNVSVDYFFINKNYS